MDGAVYTTREAVMRSPDIKAAAYAAGEIDQHIEAGARMVDKLCHRTFAPWTGTRSFDWPNRQGAGSDTLWLDQHELASLSAMSSGGAAIPTNSVFLEPYAAGPPYNRLTLNQASNYSFSYGDGIGQRSLLLTGVWCGSELRERPAGAVSGGINASVVLVSVSNFAGGVGSLLRAGDERMIVTARQWALSGQSGTLASNTQAQLLPLVSAAGFTAGDELLLDAERVLVRDVAGNNLIVQRAYGGSALAAHTMAPIFRQDVLVVQRGAMGTTAAAHADGTLLAAHVPPAPIEELNRAYALNLFFQQGSGFARTIGSQESEREFSARGIRALEEQVYGGYGRRYRTRAI